MEIVKSTSVVISEQNENDIKEGVQWLKDWLQKRLLNEDIRNDFTHYEGMNWQEIYTDCANKLDGMKFIVGKDGEDVASILREDLQSGKIHLNDRYLRRFKNDTDKKENEKIAKIFQICCVVCLLLHHHKMYYSDSRLYFQRSIV